MLASQQNSVSFFSSFLYNLTFSRSRTPPIGKAEAKLLNFLTNAIIGHHKCKNTTKKFNCKRCSKTSQLDKEANKPRLTKPMILAQIRIIKVYEVLAQIIRDNFFSMKGQGQKLGVCWHKSQKKQISTCFSTDHKRQFFL